jgi:hypothetical protein
LKEIAAQQERCLALHNCYSDPLAMEWENNGHTALQSLVITKTKHQIDFLFPDALANVWLELLK